MNRFTLATTVITFALVFSACSPAIQQSSKNSPQQTPQTAPQTSPALATGTVLERLSSSAVVKVPDSTFTVNFTSGQKTVQYGDNIKNPEAGFGTVTLGNSAAEVNGVIFTTLVVNYGGSGELFYLASFEQSGSNLVMTSSALLGDRIQLQTLSTSNQEVRVEFMDHAPNQAMVEALTVAVKNTYTYENKTLKLKE
jgi:hypothetical protein